MFFVVLALCTWWPSFVYCQQTLPETLISLTCGCLQGSLSLPSIFYLLCSWPSLLSAITLSKEYPLPESLLCTSCVPQKPSSILMHLARTKVKFDFIQCMHTWCSVHYRRGSAERMSGIKLTWSCTELRRLFFTEWVLLYLRMITAGTNCRLIDCTRYSCNVCVSKDILKNWESSQDQRSLCMWCSHTQTQLQTGYWWQEARVQKN